jgi:hypothetical protein
MNPYTSHLGDHKPIEVIAQTPASIEMLLNNLGPARAAEAPAPGKWSAREIVCHLADCELVFAFRLRQTLAEDHPVIQPFDQDRWASRYAAYDSAAALAAFAAMRQWNLALIRSLEPEAFGRPVTHPERGAMTFGVIVETMAGHDLNHLKQVEAIAALSARAQKAPRQQRGRR